MSISSIRRNLQRFDFMALGPAAILYGAVTLIFLPLLAGKIYPTALFYAFIGFAAAGAGYFATGRVRRSVWRWPNPWRSDWSEKRAEIVFWVIFGAGLLDKLIRILKDGYFINRISPAFAGSVFYSLFGVLDWLPYMAIALAWSMALGPTTPRRDFWQRVALVALGVEIIYALPSCMRSGVLIPLAIWAVAGWYYGKHKWLKLALVILVVPVVLSWGNFCRNPAIIRTYQGVPLLWQSTVSRLGELPILQELLTHPEVSPPQSMLQQLIIGLGPPRFLWPSKPATSAGGNDFGRAIGILTPDDKMTSIDPLLIGDWYWRYGLWGLILGMFGMGVLWRVIYEYFLGAGLTVGGVSAYVIVLLQVVRGLESTFVPTYVGIARLLVILFVLALFMRRTPAREPGPAV